MKSLNKLLSVLFAFLLVTGCAQDRDQKTSDEEEKTTYTKAVAVVQPLQGDSPTATVTFEEDSAGVAISATAEGLPANSKHGFHIHTYGDCSAEDGTSAGGHYAPEGSTHGEPGPNTHDGDLGNLVTDGDGGASLNFHSEDITLNGTKSIIGRSVIIHEGEDDMISPPSGAAGSRIACGVIGIANSGN